MSATAVTSVAAHGLHVDLSPRWEARLYLRDSPPDVEAVVNGVHDGTADPGEADGSRGLLGRLRPHPAAYGHPGESMNPVLHLANFALPPGRGDFGTGAVELMGHRHAFAALVEYDQEEADRPLFAARGRPRLRVSDFAPNALQRHIVGQLGCQRFFTEHGRAFCLYVVLGSRGHAPGLVEEVHQVVSTVKVGQR